VIILGLTAGLSEELLRAAGYWLLAGRRRQTGWGGAVMLGLGHGGIEAMLLAVLLAASVASLSALQGSDLAALADSPAQLAALERQMDLYTSSPLLALLPLIERILAISVHVAFSLLVWQAFQRRNALYLLLAIVLHATYDAVLVYVAQLVTNLWLIELAAALLTVPAWLWIIYLARKARAEAVASPAPSFGSQWRLFVVALQKELLQQVRTKRLLVVTAVFALFGLGSPLIANFTPELLGTIEGAEQFADLIPEPSAVDAVTQYVKNITQFGFLIAILLGMGAVAGEKERGTAAMILSKPLPRWAFILSKFIAQTIVYLVGFALAGIGAYAYTAWLFEALPVGPFFLATFALLLWLLIFAAVTLLASTLAGSTGAAAALALGGAIVLLFAGSFPIVGAFAPSALVAWANQAPLADVPAQAGALAAGLVLIVVSLVGAIAAFEVQEL
ncbi:MAG: YhfC family glutamic-type intramembrane protease, partial [Anaerolineae bacterium]|nr:YhfC family glutamic-type intramembrane protease [Anaerolineae bacterium]